MKKKKQDRKVRATWRRTVNKWEKVKAGRSERREGEVGVEKVQMKTLLIPAGQSSNRNE